jgi:hypothetical protein
MSGVYLNWSDSPNTENGLSLCLTLPDHQTNLKIERFFTHLHKLKRRFNIATHEPDRIHVLYAATL